MGWASVSIPTPVADVEIGDHLLVRPDWRGIRFPTASFRISVIRRHLLMSSSLQTVIALALVALAAALLIRSVVRKRKQPGCGDGCGAVSPKVRELQARLKKNNR